MNQQMKERLLDAIQPTPLPEAPAMAPDGLGAARITRTLHNPEVRRKRLARHIGGWVGGTIAIAGLTAAVIFGVLFLRALRGENPPGPLTSATPSVQVPTPTPTANLMPGIVQHGGWMVQLWPEFLPHCIKANYMANSPYQAHSVEQMAAVLQEMQDYGYDLDKTLVPYSMGGHMEGVEVSLRDQLQTFTADFFAESAIALVPVVAQDLGTTYELKHYTITDQAIELAVAVSVANSENQGEEGQHTVNYALLMVLLPAFDEGLAVRVETSNGAATDPVISSQALEAFAGAMDDNGFVSGMGREALLGVFGGDVPTMLYQASADNRAWTLWENIRQDVPWDSYDRLKDTYGQSWASEYSETILGYDGFYAREQHEAFVYGGGNNLPLGWVNGQTGFYDACEDLGVMEQMNALGAFTHSGSWTQAGGLDSVHTAMEVSWEVIFRQDLPQSTLIDTMHAKIRYAEFRGDDEARSMILYFRDGVLTSIHMSVYDNMQVAGMEPESGEWGVEMNPEITLLTGFDVGIAGVSVSQVDGNLVLEFDTQCEQPSELSVTWAVWDRWDETVKTSGEETLTPTGSEDNMRQRQRIELGTFAREGRKTLIVEVNIGLRRFTMSHDLGTSPLYSAMEMLEWPDHIQGDTNPTDDPYFIDGDSGS